MIDQRTNRVMTLAQVAAAKYESLPDIMKAPPEATIRAQRDAAYALLERLDTSDQMELWRQAQSVRADFRSLKAKAGEQEKSHKL